MKTPPFALTLLLLVLAAFSHQVHAVVCAAAPDTAAAALDTAKDTATGQARFAVHHYIYDAALKRTWAVVIDCRHPQWPASLAPVADLSREPISSVLVGSDHPRSISRNNVLAAASPWMLAGTTVRLWKDGQVRVQLSGTAVESAPLGAKVRVRTGEQGVLVEGIVRGPDSVELLEGGPAWRQ